MDDLLKQADDMATMTRLLQEQYVLMKRMNELTHNTIEEVRRLGSARSRMSATTSLTSTTGSARSVITFIGNRTAPVSRYVIR